MENTKKNFSLPIVTLFILFAAGVIILIFLKLALTPAPFEKRALTLEGTIQTFNNNIVELKTQNGIKTIFLTSTTAYSLQTEGSEKTSPPSESVLQYGEAQRYLVPGKNILVEVLYAEKNRMTALKITFRQTLEEAEKEIRERQKVIQEFSPRLIPKLIQP